MGYEYLLHRRLHFRDSSTHGYTSGGYTGVANSNVIDKFSFSSDGNATDVGDLTVARRHVAGQQG